MLWQKLKQRILLIGKNLTRLLAVLLLVAMILFAGCASGLRSRLPVCPPPSPDAVLDLELMDRLGYFEMYPDLIIWISEIQRYCLALEAV
jgi:hypothetical protein